MEFIVTIGIFGLVSGVIYLIFASRGPVADDAIQQRLQDIGAQRTERAPIRLYDNEEVTFWEQVANFFFGDKEMPARFNEASRRLHQAGYRGTRAVRIFWGLRIFLCLGLGFGLMLLGVLSNASMKDFLMMGGGGALFGYLLPYITVRRKANARILEMRETLPDALDLLVVCVEAGMGVDAALNRVGREQNAQGLALGEEMVLATQEMQAGAVRKEALARMADRVGLEEFKALVTFLTQTEEFGGSIARSLRVYAETMRDKRSQRAEEAARKSVIKLIFPLVFFILPTIFILVLGPPGIQIAKSLSNPLGR
jgi:tight adherence protein C